MTTPNEIKPAAPAEGLDGGRCAADAGFGKCASCGTKLVLSSGWVPSYNDPDNASGAPEAEPVCPSCEWFARFNALPEDIRTIGVAMELKTRIQQLAMEKGRLKAHYLMAVADVDAHMKNCERSLAALSLPNK